jgi:hypothetical protein
MKWKHAQRRKYLCNHLFHVTETSLLRNRMTDGHEGNFTLKETASAMNELLV